MAVVVTPTGTVPARPAASPARRYRGGRAGAVALVLSALLSQELSAAAFATLMSLGPGIAAAAGYLVLHQTLTAAGGLAVTLVIVASAGAVRTSPPLV